MEKFIFRSYNPKFTHRVEAESLKEAVCDAVKNNFNFKKAHDDYDIFEGSFRYWSGYTIRIKINEKYCLIEEDGTLFTDHNGNTEFDWIDREFSGETKIKINGKYSLIEKNGDLFTDHNGNTEFDNIYRTFDELATIVEINGKKSVIENEYLFDSNDEKRFVCRDKKTNKFLHEVKAENVCKALCDAIEKGVDLKEIKWHNAERNFIRSISDERTLVKIGRYYCDKKYYLFEKDGTLFKDSKGRYEFDALYDYIKKNGYGFMEVKINDKYCLIQKNGKLFEINGVTDFDYIENLKFGFISIRIEKKYCLIKEDGTIFKDKKGNIMFNKICQHDDCVTIELVDEKWILIEKDETIFEDGYGNTEFEGYLMYRDEYGDTRIQTHSDSWGGSRLIKKQKTFSNKGDLIFLINNNTKVDLIKNPNNNFFDETKVLWKNYLKKKFLGKQFRILV